MIETIKPEQAASPRRIFAFLLFYRWLSLSVPLVAWLLEPDSTRILALLAATAVNGLISFFPNQLNQALRQRPWLLAADMAFMAALVALTGGWQTPFYFYSLNPLLIAAFFFGLRGAVTAVSLFLPLYAAALIIAAQTAESLNWLLVVTAVIGYYLISGTFGFAAGLLASLRLAQDDLLLSHQELNMLHALTLSLQSAAHVEEVQEKVLDAVTTELGFKKAVIGLAEPGKPVISGWLGRVRDGHISESGKPIHSIEIELTESGGLAAQALLRRKSLRAANDWLNEQFQLAEAVILPLYLREHSIGVLLVETEGSDGEMMESDGRYTTLTAVASQAAVAIGTTILCINRAQQIAVQDERMRIARDLHDTVSQSLFGIIYTLDGSLKLLPRQPEEAKPELERALKTAEQVRAEIRHSILDIWPSELTAERFTADLQKYVQDTCNMDGLALTFDVRGEFSRLSSQARRSLYRISQESLANVARHAAAAEARVCVEIAQGRAKLVVRDNGRGFEPAAALAREYGREHFGLRGIQERTKTLGGECHIFSQPGEGTSIIVDIPIN